MPLTTEAIDGGLFTVSDTTRKFFADYSAALFAKDYTPLEDRPGAADAIQELKDRFADDFSCQEFKDRLYNLGMFGCGRSRRLKAIATILGLTDDQVKDCLEEPAKSPGPQSYYLPPEPSSLTRIALRPVPPPKDEEPFCPAPGHATTANDALCPTDTHTGCTEPDPEDTDDLEDPSDCETAKALLKGIRDLFTELAPGALQDREDQTGIIAEISAPETTQPTFPTPEQEAQTPEIRPSVSTAFPLYTPRTYLDAFYTTVNIHDHPELSKCPDVTDLTEDVTERINNAIITLPTGYINPDLLPPGHELRQRDIPQQPIDRYAGLSDQAARKAKRTDASARRYRANRRAA